MSDEKKPRTLPVRILHEVLLEISNEWTRFRTGSLLSIITTLTLFVLFIPRYFLLTLHKQDHFDSIIAFCIIIAFLYNIYLSYRQHQVYQRWEKWLGLLLRVEEERLGDDS